LAKTDGRIPTMRFVTDNIKEAMVRTGLFKRDLLANNTDLLQKLDEHDNEIALLQPKEYEKKGDYPPTDMLIMPLNVDMSNPMVLDEDVYVNIWSHGNLESPPTPEPQSIFIGLLFPRGYTSSNGRLKAVITASTPDAQKYIKVIETGLINLGGSYGIYVLLNRDVLDQSLRDALGVLNYYVFSKHYPLQVMSDDQIEDIPGPSIVTNIIWAHVQGAGTTPYFDPVTDAHLLVRSHTMPWIETYHQDDFDDLFKSGNTSKDITYFITGNYIVDPTLPSEQIPIPNQALLVVKNRNSVVWSEMYTVPATILQSSINLEPLVGYDFVGFTNDMAGAEPTTFPIMLSATTIIFANYTPVSTFLCRLYENGVLIQEDYILDGAMWGPIIPDTPGTFTELFTSPAYLPSTRTTLPKMIFMHTNIYIRRIIGYYFIDRADYDARIDGILTMHGNDLSGLVLKFADNTMDALYEMFYGKPVTHLPDEIIAYGCEDATRFAAGTAVTYVPPNIFDACPDVKIFDELYDGCSLTGYVPHYWMTHANHTSGTNAFRGNTGLENYFEIPIGWGRIGFRLMMRNISAGQALVKIIDQHSWTKVDIYTEMLNITANGTPVVGNPTGGFVAIYNENTETEEYYIRDNDGYMYISPVSLSSAANSITGVKNLYCKYINFDYYYPTLNDWLTGPNNYDNLIASYSGRLGSLVIAYGFNDSGLIDGTNKYMGLSYDERLVQSPAVVFPYLTRTEQINAVGTYGFANWSMDFKNCNGLSHVNPLYFRYQNNYNRINNLSHLFENTDTPVYPNVNINDMIQVTAVFTSPQNINTGAGYITPHNASWIGLAVIAPDGMSATYDFRVTGVGLVFGEVITNYGTVQTDMFISRSSMTVANILFDAFKEKITDISYFLKHRDNGTVLDPIPSDNIPIPSLLEHITDTNTDLKMTEFSNLGIGLQHMDLTKIDNGSIVIDRDVKNMFTDNSKLTNKLPELWKTNMTNVKTITSDGTEYIEIGIYPTEKMRFVFVGDFPDNTDAVFIGNNDWKFGYSTVSNKYYITNPNNTYEFTSTNTTMTLKMNANGNLTIDGVYALHIPDIVYTNNDPIGLFGESASNISICTIEKAEFTFIPDIDGNIAKGAEIYPDLFEGDLVLYDHIDRINHEITSSFTYTTHPNGYINITDCFRDCISAPNYLEVPLPWGGSDLSVAEVTIYDVWTGEVLAVMEPNANGKVELQNMPGMNFSATNSGNGWPQMTNVLGPTPLLNKDQDVMFGVYEDREMTMPVSCSNNSLLEADITMVDELYIDMVHLDYVFFIDHPSPSSWVNRVVKPTGDLHHLFKTDFSNMNIGWSGLSVGSGEDVSTIGRAINWDGTSILSEWFPNARIHYMMSVAGPVRTFDLSKCAAEWGDFHVNWAYAIEYGDTMPDPPYHIHYNRRTFRYMPNITNIKPHYGLEADAVRYIYEPDTFIDIPQMTRLVITTDTDRTRDTAGSHSQFFRWASPSLYQFPRGFPELWNHPNIYDIIRFNHDSDSSAPNTLFGLVADTPNTPNLSELTSNNVVGNITGRDLKVYGRLEYFGDFLSEMKFALPNGFVVYNVPNIDTITSSPFNNVWGELMWRSIRIHGDYSDAYPGIEDGVTIVPIRVYRDAALTQEITANYTGISMSEIQSNPTYYLEAHISEPFTDVYTITSIANWPAMLNMLELKYNNDLSNVELVLLDTSAGQLHFGSSTITHTPKRITVPTRPGHEYCPIMITFMECRQLVHVSPTVLGHKFTGMSSMFFGCSSLEHIPLEIFDNVLKTGSSAAYNRAFYYCINLKTLVPKIWNHPDYNVNESYMANYITGCVSNPVWINEAFGDPISSVATGKQALATSIFKAIIPSKNNFVVGAHIYSATYSSFISPSIWDTDAHFAELDPITNKAKLFIIPRGVTYTDPMFLTKMNSIGSSDYMINPPGAIVYIKEFINIDRYIKTEREFRYLYRNTSFDEIAEMVVGGHANTNTAPWNMKTVGDDYGLYNNIGVKIPTPKTVYRFDCTGHAIILVGTVNPSSPNMQNVIVSPNLFDAYRIDRSSSLYLREWLAGSSQVTDLPHSLFDDLSRSNEFFSGPELNFSRALEFMTGLSFIPEIWNEYDADPMLSSYHKSNYASGCINAENWTDVPLHWGGPNVLRAFLPDGEEFRGSLLQLNNPEWATLPAFPIPDLTIVKEFNSLDITPIEYNGSNWVITGVYMDPSLTMSWTNFTDTPNSFTPEITMGSVYLKIEEE